MAKAAPAHTYQFDVSASEQSDLGAPAVLDSSCEEEASLLGTRPGRKCSVVAGAIGAMAVMALGAGGLTFAKGRLRKDVMPITSFSSESTAAEYKEKLHTRIEAFAHICEECREDAKKYYGDKLNEVTALQAKCEADKSSCDDVEEDMSKVMDEVDGAWAGTDCPEEMPMNCTISSKCNPFPKLACAPTTCHPINLLKSFGENNNCHDATMECEGQEKVILTEQVIADDYKEKLHKKIAAFEHICEECREDAKKYYGAKLDEVISLQEKCEADESSCDDVQEDMSKVMDEVDGAWAGTDCPEEMPMNCTISSECNPFPKLACAPTTCHPINLLKSFGKNNDCNEATMECEGQETVSLEDA